MVMTVPRRLLVSVLACAIAVASAGNRAGRAAAEPLSPVLSDRAYWQLVTDCSEPNGFFRSENLVSNERTYQFVIPALLKTAVSGRGTSGSRRTRTSPTSSRSSRASPSFSTSGAATCLSI